MFLECLKPNIPPRNESSPHYYTCFGRVHVKTILQIVIIVAFAQHIYRWFDFLANENYTGWIQTTAEGFNALVTISLYFAWAKESAPLLLPYLIIQILCLVFIITLFCVSALTVIWPSNPWSPFLHSYSLDQPSEIQLYASIFLMVSIILALFEFWLIGVLLACYAYFNDEKKASLADIPPDFIVKGQPSDLSSNGTKTCSSDLEKGAATMMPYAPVAFPNPNFAKEREDEKNEDKFWRQGEAISTLKPN